MNLSALRDSLRFNKRIVTKNYFIDIAALALTILI